MQSKSDFPTNPLGHSSPHYRGEGPPDFPMKTQETEMTSLAALVKIEAPKHKHIKKTKY